MIALTSKDVLPEDGTSGTLVGRVWPVVALTQIIEMYVQHDCSGRVVLTQIARVKV